MEGARTLANPIGWLRSAACAAGLVVVGCAAPPPPVPAPAPEPPGPAWRRGPPSDDLAFALLQVATRRYWAGDLAQAADALERAQARAPRSARLALFRAQVRSELGPAEAHSDPTDPIASILDLWPWHPLARRLAGVPVSGGPERSPDASDPALPEGDLSSAIASGTRALAASPGDPTLVARQAVLLARADRPSEAASLLETVSADEAGLHVLLARGRLALWRGESANAAQAFDSAIEAAPAQVEPRLARIAVDLAAGRARAALERAEGALADHPDDPRVLRSLAEAALANGEWRNAEAALGLAIDADPGSVSSYHALAQLWAARRLDETGVERAERIFARGAMGATENLVLGGVYELRNRTDEAAEAYERALALAPDLPAAQNHLAWLLAQRSDSIDRALELARAAASSRPADPMIADTLGWTLLEKGRPREALVPLRRAVALLDPDARERALLLHHLATALDRAGELGNAMEASERALRALEKHPYAPWGRQIRRHARALQGG